MNLTRMTTLIIAVALACLMLTRDTLAGTTATPGVTSFAREIGEEKAVYTMPANTLTRQMNVARTSAQDFVLDVTLGSGLEFALLPPATNLGLTMSAGGAATVSASILINSDTTVRFLVDVTTDFTGFPTFTVSTTGWQLRDVNNVLGGGGGVQITIKTHNVGSITTEFDSGIDTIDWLIGEFGVAITATLVSTTAVISATTTQNFVATFPDTKVQDNGASLGVVDGVANRFNLAGTAYGLVAGDSIDLVVSGDLTGIASITWDPTAVAIVKEVTASEITAGSTTLSVAGGNASLDSTKRDIRITVDGTTPLTARTLSITVNLTLSGGAGGPSENNRSLASTATLSTWSLAGSETVPPETTITDGPSETITETTATFTFTGSDNVTPVESLVYASRLEPLEESFGAFSSSTGRNFSGLHTGSYTFRVKARDEAGNEDPTPASQTFTMDATVLVAHFMNGNTTFFKSRIYLWNPSKSSGNVTVRVFTLPNTGDSLVLGQMDLGILGAESARTIKLAEDILDPLLISLPYTNDAGNLMLEFTIEAPNVGGTAQVFDNALSLAFGTYPLSEILAPSSLDPTILVAHFMNGNTTFFKSRIYLWNPSVSSGNVTVRVFTLPNTGDSLLLGQMDLGILEAESALNIKVAEDILDQLPGITTPYTTDGGNLTLEFTIEAPNVRGAAQVFDNSLSFGTYPLKVIQ